MFDLDMLQQHVRSQSGSQKEKLDYKGVVEGVGHILAEMAVLDPNVRQQAETVFLRQAK